MFERWDSKNIRQPELDDEYEMKSMIQPRKRTTVVECPCSECFVNGNNVGMTNLRPSFDGIESSLLHQTKVYVKSSQHGQNVKNSEPTFDSS